MPKTLKRIPITFLITSLLAFILAGASFVSTQKFLSTAVKTPGMVKEMVRDTDSDGDFIYAPRIVFKDRTGNEHAFISSFYESSPSYAVGDQVELLYDPVKPDDARVNAFSELYLLTIIGGVIGGIFFLIGGGILYAWHRKQKLAEWLRQNGQIVKAKVKSFGLNTHLRVNRQSPYVIIAEWHDQNTQATYIFQSESIWFDPAPYVKEEIDVYIDPNNPKKYYVSLAGFPNMNNE